MTDSDWLDFALDRPEWAEEQIKAGEHADSLLSFAQWAWPILHERRPMVIGKAIECLAEHLEAILLGQIRRIVIMLPPGMSKSMLSNVFLPAYQWGPRGRPDWQMLSWSYGQNLAVAHNLSFRRVIESEAYRRLWGKEFKLSGDQNEKVAVQNDRLGYKRVAGIRGGGTGFRGDLLLVDDAHKTQEAESKAELDRAVKFCAETLQTRTNDDQTAICLIGHRVSPNDALGAVLRSALNFEVLCLPMRYQLEHPTPSKTSLGFRDWRKKEGELLFEERFSEQQTQEIEAGLQLKGGDFARRAQLQQDPTVRSGGMFDRRKFGIVDELPEGLLTVRGWDLAATSQAENPTAAFTAGVKIGWSRGHYYIVDVRRVRQGPGDVENTILHTARMDGVACAQDFPQDPGAAGKSQKRSLAALLAGYSVYVSPESGSKAARARPFASQVANGNVSLLRGDWNDAYLSEAEEFRDTPDKNRDGFKDQIDATSRAFARILALVGVAPVDFVIPEVY